MEPPASVLRARRDRLVAAVLDGTLAPAEMPARYAAVVDTWLAGVFAEVVGARGGGFALVAVGGYGRGELCPGSDLDVTLLHERRRNVRDVADRVWYSIWDSGVRLDHSVRTPKEAMAVARDDQRALLGLLDGRLVAGDEALAAGLLGDVAAWWHAHARQLLPALARAGRERHARFGEVAFLLEPDLKESAGGLRDLDALALAARALPALAPVLLPESLLAHRRLLLATRVALHARTGSSSDRLVLQEQDEIAPLLGYGDADDLMAGVAAAGREVMWTASDGWRRTDSYLAGPLGRSGGRDAPVGDGVVLRDGEVAVSSDAGGLADASLLVRVAVAAAEYGVPIATSALARLVGSAPRAPEPWDPELRQSFVSLLEYGAAATPVLEVLDQHRLLEGLLPEWLEVRHRPQRNAYHRFTVDRHLLEAAAQAALLIRAVRRPDLLLVGALLHDIGKGQGGDHSEVGQAIAGEIACRMGFRHDEVEVIARLVRHHLLLADTATRRDLDDPATIDLVASAVKDRLTLELLAALTEADSIATGVTAWSPWKAELVAELVARTDARLAGAALPERTPANVPTPGQLALAAEGGLRVSIDGDTLTVVAEDRPGLLSLVAGTLALHRLDIRSAVAMDDGGTMAIEVFDIARNRPGEAVDADRLDADLERALAGELLLSARLSELEKAYARGRRPAAARPPEVRVLVDDAASAEATVLEVRAPDSRSLLHRLTRVLADSGLDVMSARMSTIGHEVVDAFYVRRPATAERPSPEQLRDVVAKLAEAAAPPWSE
ncbi:MAG: [protein-PII] uridylyltransferase [Acidimicrobiales bacterium]